MGFGIPGAIGAKYVKPDAFVCALVGDGGFAMTMGELETARRIGAPILVVIVNNNMLGHIRMRQDSKFGRHAGSVFTPPQAFELVPRAFDIASAQVETLEEFRDVLPRAVQTVQSGKTFVIDVHVTDELAAGPLNLWWKE
ncbi:Acetolactate synthase-1/2/3 large subunit OS=Castellaniella defragrans OX=75697 GN=HNR28_003408 PE=3 SV=1 [Castellaniella defragrans]